MAQELAVAACPPHEQWHSAMHCSTGPHSTGQVTPPARLPVPADDLDARHHALQAAAAVLVQQVHLICGAGAGVGGRGN